MTLMTLMTFLCDNNYPGAIYALTAASSGGLSRKRGRTLYFTFSAAHMYLRRYHAAAMQQAGRSCARKNDLRKKKESDRSCHTGCFKLRSSIAPLTSLTSFSPPPMFCLFLFSLLHISSMCPPEKVIQLHCTIPHQSRT